VRGGRYVGGAGQKIPEGAALLIQDGLIQGFAAPGEPCQAKHTLDATGRIIIPGLVNAHTHAAMSLFRGLADDLTLAGFLSRVWPAEAASVSPEMVNWCSLLSCAEMLLSGTTAFADAYFFEEEVARAAELAGIRAVCGQGLIDLAAPDAPAGQGLSRLKRFLEGFPASTLVRPAVFPHTVYTCSPETLMAAFELAEEHKVGLFLHLAETDEEVRRCVRRHGVRPLRLLERLGVLDENCVIVHGVHLGEHETELAAERGVSLVHCPESNMKLASGIAPLPRLLRSGVRVALGTDGAASNNDLDMFGEMRTAACLHRLTGRDSGYPDAATILRLATRGGAEALGLESGVLEVGRPADLVILEPPDFLWPEESAADQVVFGCGRGDVRTVIVNGEVVVEEGRLTKIDLEEVMGRVREMGKGLR
jgi:5-methylthioadenosine/S-adenosylhomocysteine deaminase